MPSPQKSPVAGMLDPKTLAGVRYPLSNRPNYNALGLAGEDQTPEKYVTRAMEYWKNDAKTNNQSWTAALAVEKYAFSRMGAFQAEYKKSQADAKPADSYSPVKGYKASDIQ